jgi:hypothetical protein
MKTTKKNEVREDGQRQNPAKTQAGFENPQGEPWKSDVEMKQVTER